MSRTLRKQMLTMADLLDEANRTLKAGLSVKHINEGGILRLLSDCQETAIAMGTELEMVYGEGTEAVGALEDYCESLYRMTRALGSPEERRGTLRALAWQVKHIRELLREQIPDRPEVVFLPYKASMWDSLESVWMAADADKDCDVYVVPIPYYDRSPDGTFSRYHYEGEEFPDYVPVTHYENYDVQRRWPDVAYIHNPYDQYNFVTSVDPRFYSHELKKHAEKLVYIPYYSTTGGMSEAQASCSAYYQADRIIIQAEKFRKFFDPGIPDEKFLPFGSPKFDRVARICGSPPEPPEGWKEKLEGKTVYFYNTSLNGMLGDTKSFLKKMEYVFSTFRGREGACLLWRPHPLFESSLESMRPQFLPAYGLLKEYFLKHGLGIYDGTPDITDTIALCDAYIGDAATSVTSLFGVAGKPLFILDNSIDALPGEDDWRGRILPGIPEDPAWLVTQGNKLYHAPDGDYKYRYFCDLSGYAYGSYYSQVITIGGRHYVCPANACDIVVIHDRETGGWKTSHSGIEGQKIEDGKISDGKIDGGKINNSKIDGGNFDNRKIEKRIALERRIEQAGAFCGACRCGKYLLLIPSNYPAIVRYDTETDEVRYFGEHLDLFIRMVDGEKRIGGSCVHGGCLYLASPEDSRVLALHVETGEERILETGAHHPCGNAGIIPDGTDLWLLPYSGSVAARWNPATGEIREYPDVPEGLACTHPVHGYGCRELPFSTPAFCGDYVYFPPAWGNMFVRLNRETGEMEEWEPPFGLPEERRNGYFPSGGKAYFLPMPGDGGGNAYRLFSVYDRKLYRIDMETGDYEEIPVEFDVDELRGHEPGFQENSEWLQYACEENAFNTLADFLDGNITGGRFDREAQLKAFGRVAANIDGTCGEKVHRFMRRA